MVYKLVKSENFFFGKENECCGKLFFNRSNSNIFITFCDLNDKVIVCKTSGNSFVGPQKKKKISPVAVEIIVSELMRFFLLYNVLCVEIVLKVSVTAHVSFLVNELKRRNIDVVNFRSERAVAHNGVRGRKNRRL